MVKKWDYSRKKKTKLELLISVSTCKKLRIHHFYPYNKKMLDKLKINDFTWTHYKTEVSGQIITLKSGERDHPERKRPDMFTWSRCLWGHKLIETKSDFGKFLEDKCGLTWVWEIPGNLHNLMGSPSWWWSNKDPSLNGHGECFDHFLSAQLLRKEFYSRVIVLPKYTTANTRHISWTAIYGSHKLAAQEPRTPHTMQEYMGFSLGNRVNGQEQRAAGFVVARGWVPLRSSYVKMWLAWLDNSASWQETETHYSG